MTITIAKRIERKLKGWQSMDRDRFLHSRRLGLKDGEFLVWEVYSAFSDWDKRHVDIYGTFEVTDLEIASVLGWSSSKVCRTRNSILRKGLITKVDSRQYRVNDLKAIALVNLDDALAQKEVISVEVKNAPAQVERGYFAAPSLVSFKNIFISRSKEQYDAIVHELGFAYTDSSDLEWIDRWIYQREIRRRNFWVDQVSGNNFL